MEVEQHEALRALNFGHRIAEEEREALIDYFVETDQWSRVVSGSVDVVYGAKGSGKSAIYASLLNRDSSFFDERILLVSAERPQGTTVFADLVAEPPTSEYEFVNLWKLYVLSLLGAMARDYDFSSPQADEVVAALEAEGLYQAQTVSLSSRFKTVMNWLKAVFRPRDMSAEVKLDPASGALTGFGGKITLGEPDAVQREMGGESIDHLLDLANAAFDLEDYTAWVLFDRLDVAFAQSRQLEANALRALFKAYLDCSALQRIQLKIFLRTDIWRAITREGFREASHITRTLTISWTENALLRLVVSRALQSSVVANYYNAISSDVLSDSERQRRFFDSLVPDKIDVGNNPRTFEWILGRVRDGSGHPAPREVIHLLNATRDAQVQMLEQGQEQPPEKELLGRAAFRSALEPVSVTRLEQTLYAEFPTEALYIKKLEQAKTAHTSESLAHLWGVGVAQASGIAQQLVEIGFFDRARALSGRGYWVPHLYRPGLSLIQGTADVVDPSPAEPDPGLDVQPELPETDGLLGGRRGPDRSEARIGPEPS